MLDVAAVAVEMAPLLRFVAASPLEDDRAGRKSSDVDADILVTTGVAAMVAARTDAATSAVEDEFAGVAETKGPLAGSVAVAGAVAGTDIVTGAVEGGCAGVAET